MEITPDYNPTGALKGVSIVLMDEESVDETIGTVVCPGMGIRNHSFEIVAHADVAGVALTGAVSLESSGDPLADGGWSLLGGVAIDVSLISIPAGETEGRLEMSFSEITLDAARPRISTVIAGGTISVKYRGT